MNNYNIKILWIWLICCLKRIVLIILSKSSISKSHDSRQKQHMNQHECRACMQMEFSSQLWCTAVQWWSFMKVLNKCNCSLVPLDLLQHWHNTIKNISMFASFLIDKSAHTCTKYRVIYFSAIPYIFLPKSSFVSPCYPAPLKEIWPSNIPNRGPPKVLVQSTWILGHGESTPSITTVEGGGCMCLRK